MVRSGSDPLRAGGQRSEVGRLRDGNQRGSTEGFHGGPHQALPSGEQVTTQNGLTDKDLLELEALKLQGLRDLETQPLRDMLKRKEGASGGSGSFQSVVGDGVAVAQSHLLTPRGIPQTPASGMQMGQQGTVWQGRSTGPCGAGGLPPHDPLGQGGAPAAAVPMMGEPLTRWWALVRGAATEASAQWTASTPLEMLRLKVGSAWAVKVTAHGATCSHYALGRDLCALLCRYQPGGVHRKTMLLKDIAENRLSANR